MQDLRAYLSTPFSFGFSIAEIWSFLGPFVAGTVAALFAYFMSRKRDEASHRRNLDYEEVIAKRQAIRTKLLSAYESLDRSLPARLDFLQLVEDKRFAREKEFVSALSAVKLFGNESQASAVDRYIDALTSNGGFDFEAFMNELRDHLRVTYGLDATASRYKWVEIRKKAQVGQQPDAPLP